MLPAVPLACLLSVLQPPGVQYEDSVLQLAPLDKSQCPYIKDGSDISFQLFTKHNPTAYQELKVGNDELLFASNIDFHAPTVLYFHAFMEQPSDGSGLMVREAYMQRGEANLIMVDAHRLEAGPWYFTAAQNTWYVGRFAAQFIDYLVSRGLNLNNTQLVGHSLGAQAAGVAGSSVQSGRVARITGLDPALPLFAGLPLAQRLDPSDAEFVDVIHTDAGIFGVKEPVGHVDFYPNGGLSPQPGCELEVVIPKRLLLNKCGGTEQTNGFYTYYLTSIPNVNEYSEYYTLNRKNVDTTASGWIEPDTAKHTTNTETTNYMSLTQKHKENEDKSNIETPKIITYHKSDLKIKTVNEYLLAHKARVQRDDRETVTHTNDILKKRSHKLQNVQTHGRDLIDDKIKIAHEIIINNTAKNSSSIIQDVIISKGDNQTKENILNTTLKINNKTTLTPTSLHSTTQSNEPRSRQKRFLNIFKLVNKDTNEKFIFKALKFLSKKVVESHKAKSRQKRFLNFIKKDDNDASENIIFKVFRFLSRKVVPVITVVREINTLVKSANGELKHMTKERKEYVGANPPPFKPIAYTLELGTDKGVVGFLKKILGLAGKGDKLTIGCQ